MRKGYEAGGTLEHFSDPRAFRVENVSDVPNEPGVHVVWGPDQSLIYVGYSNRQRDRLRQHLSGDRQASILHKKIGQQLDEARSREATREEIETYLGGCEFAWTAENHPEALKARIMREFSPPLNERIPDVPGDTTIADTWDEFFYWARKFYEDEAFDALERDYKLQTVAQLQSVRTQLEADDATWRTTLKTALQKTNLVPWQAVDRLSKWTHEATAEAASALKELWGDGEVDQRIRRFSARLPNQVLPGRGTRLNVASCLGMVVDAAHYPVMRLELFNDGMRLAGHPELPYTNDEGELYAHGMSFLDRLMAEAASRDIELRDRLDAQSLLWAVLKHDPSDRMSAEERAAFARYRHEGKIVWWVNQGATYEKERQGGFLWAPQRDKSGKALAHHVNVYKLRPDDIVVHYARGAVRAIGKVVAKPKKAERPATLGDSAWGQEGYYCRVDYFVLAQPIELNEIPAELRENERPPFTKDGAVQQAYLYPLSETFARRLRHQFPERWPTGSPWEKTLLNYWLFQANPRYYDLRQELHSKQLGDSDSWVVTRFKEEMHEGDPLLLWQAGPEAGVYALGELRGVPYPRKTDEHFFESEEGQAEWGVSFKITQILEPPVLKTQLLNHPLLGALSVIKSPQGTNFRVTAEQWEAIREFTAAKPPPWQVGPPTFQEILAEVRSHGLRITERTLRRFHTAMETRGFVILSGVSGTGKTWLAEAYAKATGAAFLLVPVAPNWTTNEDLLGYFNPLDRQYHHTLFSKFLERAEAEFRAAENEARAARSHIVLLDEMNLARVEQYFAKFLSAIEVRSRSRTARIELTHEREVALTPNLFFVGTVNIDETTHGFADKVYDRVQLIELTIDRDDLADHIGTPPYGEFLLNIWDAVADIAPFAYRVVDDIRAYVDHATESGGDWREAIDEQLLQKILPKLNGTDVRLQGALEKIIELSGDAYPLTEHKAQRMLNAFQQHGFSSYF